MAGADDASEEHQTIVRFLLERVLLTVVDASEQVRLECHWHGGSRTTHSLIRPVARVKALSTYAALLARAVDLHWVDHGCADIAAILNQEACRPPKRRDTFTAPMVRRLLTTAGVIEPGLRRPRTIPERQPDEWTIRELAEELGVPQPTLYNWVQNGRPASSQGRARRPRCQPDSDPLSPSPRAAHAPARSGSPRPQRSA